MAGEGRNPQHKVWNLKSSLVAQDLEGHFLNDLLKEKESQFYKETLYNSNLCVCVCVCVCVCGTGA
jgi:hypothetical protein